MKRFVYTPTVITTLLAVAVGCTSIGPAPTPTIGVQIQTQIQTVMVPGTETPLVATATPTFTATVGANDTSEPTSTPSPTATVCSTPSKGITYIVQQGDTLNQIALRYNMSAEELQLANCLASADTIFAGQTIYVPFYLPPILIQPTSVPQVVVVPTVHKIPEGLKAVLTYDPGGARDPATCPEPTPGMLPQITLSPRVRDAYQLCVYGLPSNEQNQISVQLKTPDGHLVFSKKYPIEDDGGTAVAKIPLWMPVGVPVGSWMVTAQSEANENTISVTRPIKIEGLTIPAINAMPEGEVDPLNYSKCGHYQPGSKVVIRGANFKSNQEVILGFYSTDLFNLTLVDGENVKSDLQGNFLITHRIGDADSGTYRVVLVTDPRTSKDRYRRVEVDNDCFIVP